MTLAQAVVFILIGIITATLLFKVWWDISYRSNRQAISDDRLEQERLAQEKAKGKTGVTP